MVEKDFNSCGTVVLLSHKVANYGGNLRTGQ